MPDRSPDAYAALMARIGAVGSSRLEALAAAGQTRVKLAGCVIGREERPTARAAVGRGRQR